MMKHYETLYAIAGKYNLQHTRYNRHYMIYRNKKNAEKALENLKNRYRRYSMGIFKDLAEYLRIVEYRLVEDDTNEQ